MPLAVVTGGNRGIGLEVCRQLDDGATGGFFRDGRPIAW
jgi:NAD(P)-dependent dehydrogenase (short-subunit alcohol dehydrogenase family)